MSREYVLEGGGLKQLALASRLCAAGENVLLLVPETYLGREICAPGRYLLAEGDLPFAGSEEEKIWKEWMIPEVWEKPGQLHPDRLKRRLEDWCEEKGIRYFYQVKVLSVRRTKGGERRSSDASRAIGDKTGPLRVEGCAKCGRPVFPADVFIPAGPDREERNTVALPLSKETEEGIRAEILYAPTEPGEKSFCRAARTAMDAFAERRKEDPSLRPGRFALDGFDRFTPVWKYVRQGLAAFEEQDSEAADAKEDVVWEAPALPEEAYDLIVAGGGTAGAMAALYGARNGCRVLLLEENEMLGGTGTVGGVSSYWFGNRFADVREVDRLTGEREDEYGIPHPAGIWSPYDEFHPGIKAWVLEEQNRIAGVTIRKNAMVYGVKTDEDGSVCGVFARTKEGCLLAKASCVIDATGDGDLAVMAGADYTYGSNRDYVTYWASLAQYRTPDSYRNNFSSTVVLDDLQSFTDFIRLGRRRGEETYDHGVYVAMRESRHIRGKKTVNLKDVVEFRRWEDGIYTCYSNYDPKGKLSADMVYAGVLPPQNRVQIPLGACLPVDEKGGRIFGLIVAGKAISCTRGAFPGIRMQADLMHQGAVLGLLAAKALKAGKRVDELSPDDYRIWIQTCTGDPLTLPGQRVNLREAARNVLDLRTHWIDMDFDGVENEESGSLALMCAPDEEALPALTDRFDELCRQKERILSAEGARGGRAEEQGAMEAVEAQQAALAVYLLWHGSDLGTDALLLAMKRELSVDEGLPMRSGPTTCAQLLPDHGVMAEFTYRLNVLAWSKKREILPVFEAVFSRLLKEEREYRDIRKGVYHYVEAFAYAAERTGFPEFGPWLLALMDLPELCAAWSRPLDSDILTERLLILRLILCRAYAGIEPVEGMRMLLEAEKCQNRTIALSAKKEIARIKRGEPAIADREW